MLFEQETLTFRKVTKVPSAEMTKDKHVVVKEEERSSEAVRAELPCGMLRAIRPGVESPIP